MQSNEAGDSDSCIVIFSKGETIRLNQPFNPTDTIESIKKAYNNEQKLNVALRNIIFRCNGKILNDEVTLKQSGIINEKNQVINMLTTAFTTHKGGIESASPSAVNSNEKRIIILIQTAQNTIKLQRTFIKTDTIADIKIAFKELNPDLRADDMKLKQGKSGKELLNRKQLKYYSILGCTTLTMKCKNILIPQNQCPAKKKKKKTTKKKKKVTKKKKKTTKKKKKPAKKSSQVDGKTESMINDETYEEKLAYDAKYEEKLVGDEVCVSLQKNNQNINIEISASATVSQLKRKYMKKTKINGNVNDMVLLYMGQLLHDQNTLEQYCIGYKKQSIVFVAERIKSSRSGKGEPVGIVFINKENNSEHTLYVDNDISVLELKKIYKDYLLKQPESRNMPLEMKMLCEKSILFECTGKTFADTSSLKGCGVNCNQLQYVFVSFITMKADEKENDDNYAAKVYKMTVKEHKEARIIKQTFEKSLKSSQFQQSVKKISQTFKDTSKQQNDQIKSYHHIEDIIKEETSEDTKKATAYTKKILSTTATGKLGEDVNTTLHVVNEIFKSTGDECVFYDSREGVKLVAGDSGCAMHEAFKKDKPCILRLSTLDGLYGVTNDDIKDDTNKLVEMQSAIDNNIEHPTLIHVKNKLSAALGVAKERINIIKVFAGSDCFKYTVSDLTMPERQRMIQQDPTNKLQAQFPKFKELKIHPLFFRSAFDVACFDKRGNKSFVSSNGKFQVGPPGLKREYTQPTGWTRYGLNVLGVYGDDKWLHPFNDPGNWWRAFHGTKNAGKYGVDPRDAMADIHNVEKDHNKGWKPAKTAAYGPGVYCSPKPQFVENGYAGTVTIPIGNQQKSYKFMLQVAVKPGHDTLTDQSKNHAQIWSVKDDKDIRPYGLLLKEV